MLHSIRAAVGQDLSYVLSVPVPDWLGRVKLPAAIGDLLLRIGDLAALAHRLLEEAERKGIGIAFPGDSAFPPNLIGLPDSPPLLFYCGNLSAPRRRVAMVGSRHPDQGFLSFARRFASEVTDGGMGIVSGAAEGVDRACHRGALDASGETWAFLGSALDELDPPQAKLLSEFLAGGGIFYSELPLGVRATATTFPRRNRLISGASDVVLILRAGAQSGSRYTAEAAERQGRPLLALPGDASNEAAHGCNALIRSGRARLCLTPADVWEAAGLRPEVGGKPARGGSPLDLKELSPQAQTAYQAVSRSPRSFDELLEACDLASGALISALTELELMGLIIQYPGKQYERV